MPVSALNHIRHGDVCVVTKVCAPPSVRKRLLDLGFVMGAKVSLHIISVMGDPKAYNVAGAVIALRNADARVVSVKIAETEGGAL